MATKQLKVHLSYQKGMADTQAQMKVEAKTFGVTFKPTYSQYVGHLGMTATGGKRALTKFLRAVGLGWGVTFIGAKS